MSLGVLGTAHIDINANLSGLNAGLSRAQSSVNKSMSRIGKSMSGFGKKMTIGMSLPIIGMGIHILKTGAQFEKSMNRVKALTGATGKAFEDLEKQALKMGRTTEFSAGQVAEGMTQLGTAGFSVTKILAAIPHTLALASAAQMELGQASDITTNIMSVFRMEASETKRMVDILAQTASSNTVTIQQMGETFKYSGAIAKSAGVEFDEMAAAIGLLGTAGIRGSLAGTTLKNMIIRIVAPTKEGAAVMKQLGLQLTDAAGRIKPLGEIIKQLQPHLSKTGEMVKMFGRISAGNIVNLAAQGSEAFEKLKDSFAGATEGIGRAARMQKIQNEGLAGSWKKLSSAFEGLEIAIARSGFLQLLTDMVTKVANFVSKLAETSPNIINFGLIIAGLVAVIGPLVAVLGMAITAIAAVSAPVLIVIGAIAALTAGFVYFADEIMAFIDNPAKAMSDWLGKDSVLFKIFTDVVSGLSVAFNDLTKVASAIWSNLKRIGNVFSVLFSKISKGKVGEYSALNDAWGVMKSVASSLWSVLKSLAEVYSILWELHMNLVEAVVGTNDSFSMLDLIIGSLKIAFGVLIIPIKALVSVIKWQVEVFADMVDGIKSVLTYLGLLDEKTKQVTKSTEDWETKLNFMPSIMDNMKNSFSNGLDAIGDYFTSTYDKITKAWDKSASNMKKTMTGVAEHTKNALGGISEKLSKQEIAAQKRMLEKKHAESEKIEKRITAHANKIYDAQVKYGKKLSGEERDKAKQTRSKYIKDFSDINKVKNKLDRKIIKTEILIDRKTGGKGISKYEEKLKKDADSKYQEMLSRIIGKESKTKRSTELEALIKVNKDAYNLYTTAVDIARNDPHKNAAQKRAAVQPFEDAQDIAGQRVDNKKEEIKLYEELERFANTTTEAKEHLEELTNKLKGIDTAFEKMMRSLADSFKGFGKEMGDAVADMIRTGGKISDVFATVLDSMEKRILDFAVSKPIEMAFNALMNGIMKIFGSQVVWGGGGYNGPVQNAFGNVFSNGNLVPFAAGGIVTSPTIFPMRRGMGLMGEAGPEAVMPLERINGKLGVNARGMGSQVNVIIENNTNEVARTEETENSQGGTDIRVVIGDIVSDDIRSGGSIGRSIEQTYGTQRSMIGR